MTNALPDHDHAYYTRLAATWWDAKGPFWPLHRLNTLRSGWIHDLLCAHFLISPLQAKPFSGLKVLDIGCGGGLMSETMAQWGATVTGVDAVAKNIEVAKRHAAGHTPPLPVTYQVGSMDVVTSTFDVILCLEVVEHATDPHALLADCAQHLAPGGVLVMATLNRTLAAFVAAIVGAEYVLRWLPRGTHDWRQFVKPAEADRTLRHAGLAPLARTGVAVNPFTRQMLLSTSLWVNYMLAHTKPSA
jgi:2-polyprenyl-6-hydroxyphenyl methylase / 3-demethylubiquinone-9 3-methyltransferase